MTKSVNEIKIDSNEDTFLVAWQGSKLAKVDVTINLANRPERCFFMADAARQKLREEIELRIQIEIREKKPDPQKLKQLNKDLKNLKV